SMISLILIVKNSQKFFRAQQRSLGDLNAHIEEAYSGHQVIIAYHQEENNYKAFDEYNKSLKNSAWKSQFASGLMMPIMGFIGNASYITICFLGGMLVVSGLAGVEFIQMFIQYSRMANQPLQMIGQIANVLQSCAAASERVFEFLEEQELTKDEEIAVVSKEEVKGNVCFTDVNFGYYEDKQIIFNFNCDVKSGMKVAIVGPTGAGKTTLVNLLMRFYEVNSGTITIDSISTKDLTRNNVASLFGMVLQDTWLFEGTLRDNLRYGNMEATDEEIMKCLHACHMDHFVNSLPGGLDYIFDETANISAGQKQLLTIARAMVEDSPMLILDEATSSVDTRTEELIQKAMDKLMEGRTSFVIAHRLSTIKNADIILVLKDGNIIEQGNHEQLLNKKGFYADLYNSQFASSFES
ncbi:MAG: ABC transporter ATP-binding protein/permease, partial [Anaeroplasmataceae bacterium]|nr:ABC transporter ATP-binding protein/permease [Anaeroplasmataceae bacterium]